MKERNPRMLTYAMAIAELIVDSEDSKENLLEEKFKALRESLTLLWRRRPGWFWTLYLFKMFWNFLILQSPTMMAVNGCVPRTASRRKRWYGGQNVFASSTFFGSSRALCRAVQTVLRHERRWADGMSASRKFAGNEIELLSTHGVLRLGSFPFLFDLEDLPVIQNHIWYRDKDGYLVSCYYFNGQQRFVRFHRIVMRAQPGQVVDHINKDRSDNRKQNLRCCSRSENVRNRGI